MFVPLRAKSAATLLCLAGDELILGRLGELGPLDQQYDEKQKADGPLSTSRLLPFKLAESARGLEIGGEYAERLLKRYRPTLWADQGPKLLERLVHAYPTHGFVIDQEEAQDLGLPTRAPDTHEAALLDQLAHALIEFGTEQDLIALAGQAHSTSAAGQTMTHRIQEKRKAAVRGRTRNERRGGASIPPSMTTEQTTTAGQQPLSACRGR